MVTSELFLRILTHHYSIWQTWEVMFYPSKCNNLLKTWRKRLQARSHKRLSCHRGTKNLCFMCTMSVEILIHRRFPWEYDSERILKIGLHLLKLWSKVKMLCFFRCVVFGVITVCCVWCAILLLLFHFQTIQVGSEYQAVVPEGLCAYTSLHGMYICSMCLYICTVCT